MVNSCIRRIFAVALRADPAAFGPVEKTEIERAPSS